MKSQPVNSTFSFLPTHRQNPKKLKELFLAIAEQNCGNLKGFEITDIAGKTIFQSKIINQKSKIKIDLSILEKGIYFISSIGKDFNLLKKIVIQ